MNWKNILKWIKNPTVQRIFLLVTVFVLLVLLFKNCGRTSYDDYKTEMEQNISYYKDSLTKERNKVGQIEYERAVLASSKKDLEKQNSNLASELRKEKGNVIYLANINASLKQKIIDLQNSVDKPESIIVTVNDDGTQNLAWRYDTIYSQGNERHMLGVAKISFDKDSTITQVTITDKGDTLKIEVPLIDKNKVIISIPTDVMKIKLTTGLKRADDNLLKIFVRSDYPGFTITGIDGALIDPHKDPLIQSYFPRKRFVVGFSLGVGATVDVFGISSPPISIGPTIGVGLTYKIFEF